MSFAVIKKQNNTLKKIVILCLKHILYVLKKIKFFYAEINKKKGLSSNCV